MITYPKLLAELNSLADAKYAAFHGKLLKNPSVSLIGVKTPYLRKLAKKYQTEWQTIFAFPNDFYEVKFIKLAQCSVLPYDEFISKVDECVALMDNWALCDCFAPKSIAKNRQAFISVIQKYLSFPQEFTQRFALVCLLQNYVQEEYLPLIYASILQADVALYYVRMAAAWLLAEVLVKHYDSGLAFLQTAPLDKRTKNKAIQKANESFRLNQMQKQNLKTYKA